MRADYVDHMGDDLRVVNSARVSFNKESEWIKHGFNMDGDSYPLEFASYIEKELKESDVKLINYLARHGHWTPFSHPQITIREKVPIFVARQRFKHMVGFTYNEVSRRYVDDDPEFYHPIEWRARPDSSIKQGSGTEILKVLAGTDEYGIWEYDIKHGYERAVFACKYAYDMMIQGGVAPEQARMVLPQSMYTEYYVTGSLAAWARAYKQRIDNHAQVEIQELAHEWGKILSNLYPVSWEALTAQ